MKQLLVKLQAQYERELEKEIRELEKEIRELEKEIREQDKGDRTA